MGPDVTVLERFRHGMVRSEPARTGELGGEVPDPLAPAWLKLLNELIDRDHRLEERAGRDDHRDGR